MLATTSLLAVLTACSEPTRAQLDHGNPSAKEAFLGVDGALPRFPTMAAHVPATRVTPPEFTDAELEAAIAAVGGRAIVMLKAPGSPRAGETGVVGAIGRTEALAAREVLRNAGVEILRSYWYSSAVAVKLEPGEASRVRQLAVVDFIEPDGIFISQATSAPQDTSWALHLLQIPDIWNGTFGPSTQGEHANVTVLDNGMDFQHAIYGDGPGDLSADCGYVPTDNITSCWDPGWGHGVHVGGIIAARDNDVGVVGIAHSPARYTSIRVCETEAECRVSDIASAVQWATASARPRHILNMSFGSCNNFTVLRTSIEGAAAAGILLVASAGNTYAVSNCGVTYPAKYPEVMAVSGTLEDDSFAEPPPLPPSGSTGGGCTNPETGVPLAVCSTSFPPHCSGSRSGPEVEIAAPFEVRSLKAGMDYGPACGTSMSAGVVSGVAALLWSRNPTWSAAQVRNRLKETALPLGPALKFGSGRINPVAALYPPPPPLTATIVGSNMIVETGNHSWNASVTGGSGSPSYHWEYSENESGPFTSVGTSSSVNLYVSPETALQFWLRLSVTSSRAVAGDQIHVFNETGNPCAPLVCLMNGAVTPNARPR